MHRSAPRCPPVRSPVACPPRNREDRDDLFQFRWLGRTHARASTPRFSKKIYSVFHCPFAHGQQFSGDPLRVFPQTVPLEGSNILGNNRMHEFTAQFTRGFPHVLQGDGDVGGVVQRSSPSLRPGRRPALEPTKLPHRRLAVHACHKAHVIQNLAPALPC